ncbi:MAG TPA: succinate dehydrogenase/fumarate reductase flavoprotein subunit, partial [Gammaproteobacteria bacterium]|nr:succinate dehydrogenase/fumarate reductase flavoprotein subunit [Gammaproteobacteria bacterium]
RLLDAMWDGVGVLRDADGLTRAQRDLVELKAELHASGLADNNRVFNLSWHDWLNLNSLIEVSEVIAAAALSRENSRGAHYREDFPQVGSLEDSYFTVARLDQERLAVERQPVVFSIVKPGESLLVEES